MTHEECNFQVEYTGDPKTIKSFDFSESLSGITGLVKEAYYIYTGRSVSEITTIITEIKVPTPNTRNFDVNVIAEHDTENKVSLETILKHLGFLGKVT
jgi:hypothetical protein